MIVGCNIENFPKCEFGSETWFNIGKILHSLSNESSEGYQLWLNYSQTDQEKYDEILCYESWCNFEWMTYETFCVSTQDPEDLPEGW